MLAPNVHPPTDPLAACILVAFKSPDNCTAEAVSCPVAPLIFTLPPVDVNSPAAITNPPMSPEVAETEPEEDRFVAVTAPAFVTLNTPPLATIELAPILIPPMSPLEADT